eukprot:CAMPEP_0172822494 /NCGR_PEP_ID=MMETSP1075-20121228/16707_1 /TAXON_ID=2916 /ORGANISM="Ceratium fusus, Strain PA161109" /LENGTH=312 /DNA_ID=CAMNT_0013663489 /DNA_START=1 /DNA_END=939 /DNA_ORIENTATION=+
MGFVRDCDLQRALAYSSYDLAWLTPVVFPLSMSLFTQGISWILLWRERLQTDPSIGVLTGGLLLVETFFGVFCICSCLANFVTRDYVGGETACGFQGWYAGWYVFSQLPMLAAMGIITGQAVRRGSDTLPSPKQCALGVIVVLIAAAFIAALPFLGVSHYSFPKDYCSTDLQDRPYAALFLLDFLFTAGCIAWGPLRVVLGCIPEQNSSRSIDAGADHSQNCLLRIICAAIVALFTWGFTVAAVISVVGLVQGSTCDDPFATSSPVFGLNAIFLHVQQLVNPVLYGVYLRRQLSTEACSVVNVMPKGATSAP